MRGDFGHTDNLMIDASLAVQGRAVRRVGVPSADRFESLDGFRACLAAAKAFHESRGLQAA